MKIRSLITCGVVVGLLSASAFADTAIGVVNVKDVFANSAAVKAEKTKLQADFQSKHQKLLAEQNQLKSLYAQYKKNETVMSKSDKQKLQTQIAAQQSKLYQLSQMYSQQADAAQDKAMQSFLVSLQKATEKVAEQKHLNVVLPNTGVIYSAQSDDITAAVEKAMNS